MLWEDELHGRISTVFCGEFVVKKNMENHWFPFDVEKRGVVYAIQYANVLLTLSINLQVLYHLHHSLLATFSGEDSHKKGTGELIGNFGKTPKRY